MAIDVNNVEIEVMRPSTDVRVNMKKDLGSFTGFVDMYAVNKYQFLNEAYAGNGGFETNSYLVPYPVESYYDYRRKFSHYVNFFAPVLDAMIRPCFEMEPQRKCEGSLYADPFFTDCDGAGRTLTEFMKDAATLLRRHGVVYVMVDNVTADDMPKTAAEAVAARAFPYVSLKSHAEVEGLMVDRFGALCEVVFADGTELVSDGNNGTKKVSCYKRINASGQVRFFREGGKEVVLTRFPCPSVFPVVALRIGLPADREEFAPFPAMFTLARLCHAIYNKDSEIREIERKQEFAILTVQGGLGDVAAGAGSMLGYPMEATHAPAYIAPDPATLIGLLASRKELREDLYRIAEQSGVTGVAEAKSGVALAFEFRALAFVLNETSNLCEVMERGIMKAVFAFTGERGARFETAYRRAFSHTDGKEETALDEALLAMDIPKKFKDDILVDLYRKRFPESTKEEIDEIKAELEKAAVDEAHGTDGLGVADTGTGGGE